MDAKQNIFDFQMKFFEIFKSQDPGNVFLDVVFDIGGKKLYGNKTKSCIISPTFESMLSERWTSKNDEPIQIKDYKFEDFKEFLTFTYSGECSLTDDNIFAFIDMAEFYGIQILKNACENYLSKMDLNMENVFSMMELSNKYSLVEVKKPIQHFISTNFMDFIKCEGFLNARKEIVKECLALVCDVIKPEELFQAVYEWVEHQAKQMFETSGVDLNETIKTEITPFLPYIEFKKMSLKFLHIYVVKKGFLFSYDELSEILDNANTFTSENAKVKVTNSSGHSISGYLPRNSGAVEVIKSLKNCLTPTNMISWPDKCNIHFTPSPLKKRDGVEWYLVYSSVGGFGYRGNIALIHQTNVHDGYYLLAEMVEDTFWGFLPTTNCKVEIE